MDDASTTAAIDLRCCARRSDVPIEELRAYVLREPPCACLWTAYEISHRIGGIDERFVGWGGENNDIVARLQAAGPFARFDDPLLHLYYGRPALRRNGQPLNPAKQPTTWTMDRRRPFIGRYRTLGNFLASPDRRRQHGCRQLKRSAGGLTPPGMWRGTRRARKPAGSRKPRFWSGSTNGESKC